MCRKARRVNDASHPCANAACSNRMHSDCAAAHYDAVKKRLLNHTDNINWEDELRFCPDRDAVVHLALQLTRAKAGRPKGTTNRARRDQKGVKEVASGHQPPITRWTTPTSRSETPAAPVVPYRLHYRQR